MAKIAKSLRTYILDGRTPILEEDGRAWGNWFEKNYLKRHIAETTLPNGVYISTVFLGVDHNFCEGPPILFETMIFEGPEDGYQERYSTWGDAMLGHGRAVSLAKEAENK